MSSTMHIVSMYSRGWCWSWCRILYRRLLRAQHGRGTSPRGIPGCVAVDSLCLAVTSHQCDHRGIPPTGWWAHCMAQQTVSAERPSGLNERDIKSSRHNYPSSDATPIKCRNTSRPSDSNWSLLSHHLFRLIDRDLSRISPGEMTNDHHRPIKVALRIILHTVVYIGGLEQFTVELGEIEQSVCRQYSLHF